MTTQLQLINIIVIIIKVRLESNFIFIFGIYEGEQRDRPICSDLRYSISQKECLSIVQPYVTKLVSKIRAELVECTLHSESYAPDI